MRHALRAAAGALLVVGAASVSGCARDGAAPAAGAPAADPHAGHGSAARTTAVPVALHDDAYAMTFDVSPSPTAGGRTTIRYAPRTAGGEPLADLALNHERLTHLIVVSRDLAHFDHVHPERQPDGSFALPYTFSTGGEYVLYADYLPAGASGAQVFDHAVRVGGDAPPARPLGAATSEATANELTVHLDTGGPLRAGREATLAFHVTDGAGELADLQPYLEAGGHVVVIPEGADGFLHVRPTAGGEHGGGHGGHGAGDVAHDHGAAASAPTAHGPVLRFATAFPSAGRYKLWLQVQRAGRVRTLPFVLDVA